MARGNLRDPAKIRNLRNEAVEIPAFAGSGKACQGGGDDEPIEVNLETMVDVILTHDLPYFICTAYPIPAGQWIMKKITLLCQSSSVHAVAFLPSPGQVDIRHAGGYF